MESRELESQIFAWRREWVTYSEAAAQGPRGCSSLSSDVFPIKGSKKVFMQKPKRHCSLGKADVSGMSQVCQAPYLIFLRESFPHIFNISEVRLCKSELILDSVMCKISVLEIKAGSVYFVFGGHS